MERPVVHFSNSDSNYAKHENRSGEDGFPLVGAEAAVAPVAVPQSENPEAGKAVHSHRHARVLFLPYLAAARLRREKVTWKSVNLRYCAH